MTRRGIIYSVVLLFLLILSFGMGIKELFMISCCMALLLAYSAISSLLAAMTVFVKTDISSTDVSRNDKIVFNVNLNGFVLLPVTGDIYVSVPGRQNILLRDAENHVFCRLPGKCKKQFSFTLNCDNKGMWYVGIKRLRIHDVFGLFSLPLILCRKSVRKRYEVKIYPRCYNFEFENQMLYSKIGNSATVNNESDNGDSVMGSRKYQFGDPFKRINWKQTVRTRSVYVRNYELEQISQVLIMLDNSAPDETQNLADIAGDICVSLNKFYINNGATVKNRIIRIKSRKAVRDVNVTVQNEYDYMSLCDDLISIKPATNKNQLNMPIDRIAQTNNFNVINIISASPSRDLLEKLAEMRESGYLVNCIVPATSEENANPILNLGQNIGFSPIIVTDPTQMSDKFGGLL